MPIAILARCARKGGCPPCCPCCFRLQRGFVCLRLNLEDFTFHSNSDALLTQVKKWKLGEKMPLAKLVTDPSSENGFCADPTLPAELVVNSCTGARPFRLTFPRPQVKRSRTFLRLHF